MGLKGNNLFNMIGMGQCISPQDVNNTTVNGDAIDLNEIRKQGRQLVFFANIGPIPATTDGSFTFQTAADSGFTSNVATLKEDDGTTALVIEGVDDGSAYEDTPIIASIDLVRIDDSDADLRYLRINAVNGAATALPVSVHYAIYDLYTHPSGVSDEIYNKLDGDTSTS